jgi:hypothetical protein
MSPAELAQARAEAAAEIDDECMLAADAMFTVLAQAALPRAVADVVAQRIADSLAVLRARTIARLDALHRKHAVLH